MQASRASPVRARSWTIGLLAAMGAALVLAVAVTSPAGARPQDDGETPLLDTLARVPATPDATGSVISYVDYRAVEAARPGTLVPSSLDELLALDAAGDPAAARWFAAAFGIASGPSDLLNDLMSEGPSWPDSVGFDFMDIDRAIAFGAPPSDGTVLVGAFDPSAIAAAYRARGYTATPAGDHALLCSAKGCDAGLELDLAGRDTRVPFGGRLGRQEPLAASVGDLLSSADLGSVEAMLATAGGAAPSLADDPAYRAVAAAPDDGLTIVQATLLPRSLVVAAPDLVAMVGATPEQVDALLADIDALEPLPDPEAVAILDGATATEQVVTIALAYADEADASRAAEVVAGRLRGVRSLARDVPLADLLEQRGVTRIATRVEPTDPDADAAAVIELRAPLASDVPTEAGRPTPSSALYRLFVDLIQARDLLWLAPSG